MTDDLRRLVLALDHGGDDLALGAAHADPRELAHRGENLGTLHQGAFLG